MLDGHAARQEVLIWGQLEVKVIIAHTQPEVKLLLADVSNVATSSVVDGMRQKTSVFGYAVW